jgi:glycosyltransferase involved in cell wall biosynthesis
MTVYFYEPPMRQKVGGLDLAVRSLRSYLLASGVPVKSETDFGSDNGNADGSVIHFHGLWQPQFLKASRRCRIRNIPYVVSPHGMLEPWAWKHKLWKKWPYFLLMERPHMQRAASLLATSDMEAANLRRFFPRSQCSVIPLGLPDARLPGYAAARQRRGWQSNETILLFLSRIHPKKGLEFLLNGLADMDRESRTGVRLVIVGGGEPAYITRLRALAERRASELPPIDWMGEIWGEEKWSYLQGADLFCLPSYSENFGLAVLEALQVGTRVLTTNTVPWQFLSDWKAGFIVEPSADAVRMGLKTFLGCSGWTDQQRTSLANRVRQKFGWETVGPEYLRLYQSAIECRRPTANAA